MKQGTYMVLFFIILVYFSSCKQELNNADYKRITRIDSLLTSQPDAVLDSLKLINLNQLSHYNKAYCQLLEVIAKDKTYFNFTTDSLINLTVDELFSYKTKHPESYVRALIYQGIVRYRMKINDSTAYQPLKEALRILHEMASPDLRSRYLCLYYLGEIHDKNNNIKLAKNYYIRIYYEVVLTFRNNSLF
ncbi:MAG: hypothetical protein PHH37_15415 [Paludibacter sp.]|nr:hypothetical protein [Paludibacter sp.]